jgi:thiamine pyrophosphokinase
LLIFFVAGALGSVADHWVHMLPQLLNSSPSQNFDIHKYLNNHGKLSFALQQQKVLVDPSNSQVGVFGEIGLLEREGGDDVTLQV